MRSASPARIRFVRLGLTSALAIVAVRAGQLAVQPDPRLARLADRQYSSYVELAPKRGTIYDRRGNVLAQSVEVDSIYADPRKLEKLPSAERRKLIGSLARALEMPERQIAERFDSDRGFIWLKRRVDPETAKAVAALEVDGVGSVRESKRYYPNVELASHLLGFAGLDSEGLEGLEQHYDEELKSDAKRYERPRDARGRGYADGVFVGEEETGTELVLTIDQQIQFLAESALRAGVENSKASSGFVIVQDPRTGEILAMAGYPAYNPNAFAKASADRRRNRAITDVFEPGSTLKPVIAAAALDAKVVDLDDIFFCENGELDVADVTIRDLKKHGWLDLARILSMSSNIGMIKIGRALGKESTHDALIRFGFGAETGVDFPGEPRGIVPAKSKFSSVTLATASFGHGVGVTGLQLVNATSAIANGGTLMKPYVVRRVLGPDEKIIRDVDPVEIRRVIAKDTAEKMTRILEGVVAPGGTGSTGALASWRVAGKTGTAQKVDVISGGYSNENIASFAGFAPASRPRLTILVVLDEPKTSSFGGVVAGPVFREIADGALRYLGVPPDRTGPAPNVSAVDGGEGFIAARVEKASDAAKLEAARALAKSRAARGGEKAIRAADTPDGVLPDFTGLPLRAALRVAEPRQLDVEVRGSGRVIAQEPQPGSKAEPGAKVKLTLEGA